MTATIGSSTADGRDSLPRPWLWWITEQLRTRHWSDHEFAAELGMSTAELDRLRARANVIPPSYDEVRRVAYALRCPLQLALVGAGLATPEEIHGVHVEVTVTAAVLSMFPSPVLVAEVERRTGTAPK